MKLTEFNRILDEIVPKYDTLKLIWLWRANDGKRFTRVPSSL